jgi:putative membrane protein
VSTLALEKLFSATDQEAIRQAVSRAEARTGGEVVPYVVQASGSYTGAPWRGAALLAVLATLGAAMVHTLVGVWGGSPWLWGVLPAGAGVVLGLGLSRVFPAVRRWWIPTFQVEEQVEFRAAAAFVEAEVFNTRDRTGVLLFISLFEHRVLVLADSGIHARVAQDAWDHIATDLASGIKAGRLVPALLEAIDAVGRLLEAKGVERRADDENELADGVRLGDG